LAIEDVVLGTGTPAQNTNNTAVWFIQ